MSSIHSFPCGRATRRQALNIAFFSILGATIKTELGGGFQPSVMRDRLEIIRRLLADDGSLWITIAYRGVTAAQAAQRWSGLTLKKIPKMVKDRCEWGHDDYSLNVANLPMAAKKPAEPAQDELFAGDGA